MWTRCTGGWSTAAVRSSKRRTRFGSGVAAYVCTVQDPEGKLWTFDAYRGPSSA